MCVCTYTYMCVIISSALSAEMLNITFSSFLFSYIECDVSGWFFFPPDWLLIFNINL